MDRYKEFALLGSIALCTLALILVSSLYGTSQTATVSSGYCCTAGACTVSPPGALNCPTGGVPAATMISCMSTCSPSLPPLPLPTPYLTQPSSSGTSGGYCCTNGACTVFGGLICPAGGLPSTTMAVCTSTCHASSSAPVQPTPLPIPPPSSSISNIGYCCSAGICTAATSMFCQSGGLPQSLPICSTTCKPVPVPAPAPVIAPLPPPTPPGRNCCICQYQDFPICATLPADKCVAVAGAPYYCSMSKGSCISDFKQMCETWLAGQTQCQPQDKLSQSRDTPLPTTLASCTSINQIMMGHGQSCTTSMTRVIECLHICKDATCLQYEDAGCSVLANETEATKWVNTLRSFYADRGMTLTVSGNQTTAGWPGCENRVTYNVMPGTTTYAPCQPGGGCYSTSTPIKCTTTDGRVIQSTCCLCGDKDGVWSDVNGSCPALTDQSSPIPERSAWAFVASGGCNWARNNVSVVLQNMRNYAEQECATRRGKFSWDGEVVTSMGTFPYLFCKAYTRGTYSCMQMCK